MIRHNFVLILRHFARHKTTFFINLTGLTAGLACVLTIFLWVRDEMRMDAFHANNARLFQVMANHPSPEGIRTLEATPDLLAETLAAEMPEVERATAMTPPEWFPKFILSKDGEKVKSSGMFADRQFFNVFSFELTQGQPDQVLQDKTGLVVSEKLAETMFGSAANAIGQPIDWQLAQFKSRSVISGVFKGTPAASSMQFDFVLSMEMFRDPVLFQRQIHWDNHTPSAYVLLKKGADSEAFSQKIAGFLKTKYAQSAVTLFLQPYAERYLHGKYEDGRLTGGRIDYVRLFSLIALFILGIACINFTNLSTAKAAQRSKEVGIKKAIGVSKSALALQYLGESMLLSFAALALAVGITGTLLPQFNALTGKELNLTADFSWLTPALGIAAATGLLAGAYPALYLSGFRPVAVLKGKIPRHAGELWARKGLVVAQFSLSVIFIVAVMVVYRQMQLVQTRNMGYDREHVIYFEREGALGERLDAFLEGVRQVPGVAKASAINGSFVDNDAFTLGIEWPGKVAGGNVTFANLTVHYDLLETLGLDLAEGRTFSREFGADSSKIIFNEAAIAAMGLKDPLGQTVKLWGEDMQIVGVVKNFHFQSLHETVKPAFFRLDPNRLRRLMVRLEAGRETEALAGVAQFYKSFNPGYAFEYKFLDEDFQKQYTAERRVSELSKYFAGLAILLSCLGLFGLATFAAERRAREIGVRKVLGASVASVTGLLSADFLKLVLAAIVIATPVAWYFTNRWLEGFAYRIDLSGWMFAAAGLAALGIALLTVGFQSVKAALANPVDSLRNE